MKKTMLLALLLFIGFASAATVILNESNSANIGDTYVKSDQATTNFGTQNTMHLQGTSPTVRLLLLFNLSAALPISGINITSAVLNLYATSSVNSNPYTANVYNTTGGWAETGVTWNTQPSADILQNSTLINGVTTWYAFNITNAASSAYQQKTNLSVLFKHSTEAANNDTYFATKEYATAGLRPQLVITYVTSSPLNETGLVGYWKFDENNGTWTLDSSGNENHGQLVNSQTWTAGKNYQTPYALSYDGINQYVSVSDSNSINITGNSLTVSMWIKYAGSTTEQIFQKGADYYCSTGGYCTFIYADGHLRGAITNSTNDNIGFNSNVMTVNTWHHVAMVYNSTHVFWYVDGVVSGTPVAFSGNIKDSSTYPLYIGGLNSLAYFNGTTDEVKIYNYSLSASQIMAEYTRFCPLYPLNITTYNESSSSQSVGFDLVASNTSSSFAYNNANNFTDYYCNSSFPINSATIKISNSSFYSPRYYYPTLSYSGNYSLNAYLLSLGDLYAVSPTIIVKNTVGGVVTGALVSMYKTVDSTSTLIAQDIADGVGQTYFNLDAQTSYTLIINATGYTQYSITFQPSQSIYTITLNTGVPSNMSIFNDTGTWGVTWNLTPSTYMITGIANFNFSIANMYNDLEFWGMNVTYNNSNRYTINSTNASGGFVNFTLNTSLLDSSNEVNVSVFFKRVNLTYYDPTYTFNGYTITAGNYTLVGAMIGIKNSGLGKFSLGLIAILCTTIVMGYVATAVSFTGGVILAVLMLWVFGVFGYMDYLALIQLTIIGVGMMLLRNRL